MSEEKSLDPLVEVILNAITKYDEEVEKLDSADGVIALARASALTAVFFGVSKENYLGMTEELYDEFHEARGVDDVE
jgi:hypothetical protein